MLHHFVTPDARWGVTSPLWDWVFRTMGKRARVPRLDRPLMRGRFRWRMLAAAVLLIGGVLVAADPARAAEWEWLSDKDGLLIERRPVNGSSFPEVRATAKSPLPPAAVFETLWKQREYPEFIPHLKRLDVLSDVGDDRVTYEQVAVPLGRDRDYTVRLRRRVDLWTQRYEILFASANEVGPPPDGRHERVRSIRGRWTVEPDPGGTGSVVRYEVQTDPGGVIPAWIVKRAQRGAVADLVRAVLTRAREMSGQK
jgi:ribosome-associated toxin RatA of RatAB toxin-antitoxin module